MLAFDAMSHQTADLRLAMFTRDFCQHISEFTIDFNENLLPNVKFSIHDPKYYRCKLGVVCRRSYLDACENSKRKWRQPKNCIRKSAIVRLHVYTVLLCSYRNLSYSGYALNRNKKKVSSLVIVQTLWDLYACIVFTLAYISHDC